MILRSEVCVTRHAIGPVRSARRARTLLFLAGSFPASVLPIAWPHPAHAQVVQLWSHQAAFGDASGVVAMGDTLMFVCNNEDEHLRLYARYPASSCASNVYSFNARPDLGATGSDLTADLESAVKVIDANGTRIYWLGGLDNTKNGNLRPNRNRVFATLVSGDGSGTPPYTLGYVGRYDKLRDDILAWDINNLHGLGANYFGLAASAALGVSSQQNDGFNVEGLTLAPDGTTAYIGFRAPLVNGAGPTTPTSPRTHALIIPLLNLPALVTGNPTPGPGAAQLGAPILLPLGSRGVRSIDHTYPGQYLITAGPTNTVSDPPVAPLDFRLFTWSGNPLNPPAERSTAFDATYSPEGCMLPNTVLGDQTIVQFVNDDGGGNGCWRSMNCHVGQVAPLDVPFRQGSSIGVRFSLPPAPNPARDKVSFSVTSPGEQWVDVTIHDLEGRRLATLWSGDLPAGEHRFSWQAALLENGRRRAGLYWVRLRARGVSESRPFALMP